MDEGQGNGRKSHGRKHPDDPEERIEELWMRMRMVMRMLDDSDELGADEEFLSGEDENADTVE